MASFKIGAKRWEHLLFRHENVGVLPWSYAVPITWRSQFSGTERTLWPFRLSVADKTGVRNGNIATLLFQDDECSYRVSITYDTSVLSSLDEYERNSFADMYSSVQRREIGEVAVKQAIRGDL